ncbi:MAG TPA: histidine kinase [Terrimesophilobacter sp.]|jgi:Signal transduction histidine kinase|uniref:sensor histidine kinase n=1 Tax=Terrimesophilobacter sp. TaxID=2906435 RepID=UPI002F93CB02
MFEWLERYAFVVAQALLVTTVVLLAAGVVLLVLWLRARGGRRRELAERVEAQRSAIDIDLELREQLGRLRMVRELHEVAVHSVSVIISQADGARYAAEADPGVAVRSAAVIAETARKTLADLRRVMTLVRDGEAQAAPQPRLRTARDLFTVMRDAGLSVVFEENGSPFDLHQGAELAVYRILQESLSNALKYGGEGTEVKVSFTWRDESLQVLVDDDGVRAQARRDGIDPHEAAKDRGPAIDEDLGALTEVVTGPGITEMRERAALFGGVFNAYSVPGVGFSISVVFPALKYDNGVHGVNLGR